MKLEFFKAEPGNFGDDLNAWLWPQLFPGLLDNNDNNRHLIGIGSLLDARYVMLRGTKIVFGSGARTAATVPKLDASWDIRFVRGPLTAAALGLDPSSAITDGAAAILTLGWKRGSSTGGAGFMPHYRTLAVANWKKVCEQANLQFIDPTRPIPEVLHAIGKVDRLITEALHGAIIADLLRVPWLRVRCHSFSFEGPAVSEFKWRDWGGSLGVNAAAMPFPAITLPARSLLKRAVTYPRRVLSRATLGPALKRLGHSTYFQLSKTTDLDRAAGRIHAHVRQLRDELEETASRSLHRNPRTDSVTLA